MTRGDEIIWPAGYEPEVAAVYAVNQIDVVADPSVVWDLLVHPHRWPEYYPHARVRDVSTGEELGLHSTFIMHTAEVDLSNTVREYEPLRRIAWEALYQDSAAYHVWIITPTQNGCRVHTEETQHGPFWERLDQTTPGALHQVHQTWIDNLAAHAQDDSSPMR